MPPSVNQNLKTEVSRPAISRGGQAIKDDVGGRPSAFEEAATWKGDVGG